MPIEAAITIVNYNCKEILKCIKSIKENNYPKNSLKIIVVDNNSSDNSMAQIKKNSQTQNLLP